MARVTNFIRKLWINVGVVSSVLIVFGISVAYFSFSISESSRFIFSTTAKEVEQSEVVKEVSRLEEAFKEVEPAIAEINRRIPLRDSVITFSDTAKNLADENDLVFIFRFGQESSVGNLFSSSFNITIQGDYKGVTTFINKIEDSPYFVRFGEVSMVRQLEKYSATLNGKLIFKKEI